MQYKILRFSIEYFSSIKYFFKNYRFLDFYKTKSTELNNIFEFDIIFFSDYLGKLQVACLKCGLGDRMLVTFWNRCLALHNYWMDPMVSESYLKCHLSNLRKLIVFLGKYLKPTYDWMSKFSLKRSGKCVTRWNEKHFS